MAEKCGSNFDAYLLDHIKFGRNYEAMLMLNEELAKKSDDAGTLLHRAASYDNVEIVKHLIELGSDLDFSGAGGQTPLMIAAQNEHLASVKVLLHAGANIDAVDAKGQSALQMVFHSDYYDNAIIEEFLHKVSAASSKIKDLACKLVESGCALHHAIFLKKLSDINCMLSYYDLEAEKRERAIASTEQKPVMMLLHLELPDCDSVNFGYGNLSPGSNIHRFFDLTSSDHWDHLMTAASDKSYRCYENDLFELVSSTANNLTAYLAMLEKLGTPIVKTAKFFRVSWPAGRMIMEEYYEQCQKILTTTVFRNSTLFDLLTDPHDKMRVYVRNETFVSMIEEACTLHELSELFPYYFKMLTMRIERAKQMVELEDSAIAVIYKIFNSNHNECYNFSRQVVGYLNKQELKRLYLYGESIGYLGEQYVDG